MLKRSVNGPIISFVTLILIVLLTLPVGISDTKSSENIAKTLPHISSIDVSADFDTYEMAVSDIPLPPPGIMPVVVLQGSPYEMGYQYALQQKEYIAIVRDAAWASALAEGSHQEILDNCSIYYNYITTELPDFDFISFFCGISDSMTDQGTPFFPEDCIVMLHWGGRKGPQPPDHCTAFAACGNATVGGAIAAVNFDYYQVPSNSYSAVLALYPESGYSCIVPSGIGRTGSNCAFNQLGLTYIMTSGAMKGPGDAGQGLTGFLILPYVGMTCKSVPEAADFLINSTRMFGLIHLLMDSEGNVSVLETTRARYGIRHPGDNNESDYVVVTNHYLNPAMKPSQPIWNPLEYYPSSYYRYITTEKIIHENSGNVSFQTAVEIQSKLDWWDGKEWHLMDPWSTNTINRFRPYVATIYSAIAMPSDGVVSICTGNPGMPYWGTLSSDQAGVYVNLTVGETPEDLVFALLDDAKSTMWDTVRVMGMHPPKEAADLWGRTEDAYWEGVWWLDRAFLTQNRTAKATAWGESATKFVEVIARSKEIQAICQESMNV